MMEKSKIGFALLLLGIIFAVPAPAQGGTIFWYIGLIMGLIGIVMVILDAKKKP